MVCQSEFLQYARKTSVDPRGLGHWCLWPFYCNPNHVTRIIVAYRTCHTKIQKPPDDVSTTAALHTSAQTKLLPVELYDKDLTNQIKEWRKS